MTKKQSDNKISFILRPRIGLVSYTTGRLHSAGYKLAAKCRVDDPKLNTFIKNKKDLGFKVKILTENIENKIVHIWLKASTS